MKTETEVDENKKESNDETDDRRKHMSRSPPITLLGYLIRLFRIGNYPAFDDLRPRTGVSSGKIYNEEWNATNKALKQSTSETNIEK